MKPNIIYLHSHDTGRFISPYGHKVRTPNLQRFAEEGVMFRQCYCANPTCSPSRAALLTGEYAHSAGMFGLAHRGFEMPDYSKHLLHTLRNEAGYKTALAGIQHIVRGDAIEKVGYDEILCSKRASAQDIAAEAVKFLKREHNSPFFLSVGCFETHRVFPEPAAEDDPRWVSPPPFLPDSPMTRADMAAFNTSAHQYDAAVGDILDCLDETGLAEDTLVILTTDHGIAFPRAKCTMYDPGIGVLLMMRGPEPFKGGAVMDALVSHVDVYPTVCDYLGIPAPDRLQGTSFLPLVKGEVDKTRDAIFAEVNFHASFEPQRCVRTERYKYIRRFLKREKPLLANVDAGPSKDLILENGWADKNLPREELYDILLDPNEANNIINDTAMQNIADDLRERMESWMHETDDPAVNGMRTMDVPDNAVVNDSDDANPIAKFARQLTPEFRAQNEIPRQ